MTKAATLTKPAIKRAIDAATERGWNSVAIRPDGTVYLMRVENPLTDIPVVPQQGQDAQKWRDE